MNYLNLLINPVKFFKQAAEKEKQSLLIPILIIAIIGGLTGVIAANTASSMELPADQMGMIKTISIVTAVIFTIIGVSVGMVVKAAIFNLVLKKWVGKVLLKPPFMWWGLTISPRFSRVFSTFSFKNRLT